MTLASQSERCAAAPAVAASNLTGRISAGPSELLDEEILQPQFSYEAARLLPWYVAEEKVLLAEYLRMGLLNARQAHQIGCLLDSASEADLIAEPDANMSDLAFALEAYVLTRSTEPAPIWHVDRSRNDLQACAQLLFGRDQLRETAAELLRCFRSAQDLATRYLDKPMPGYTHLQPAQVMTPGFYIAGLSGQLLHSLRRLLAVYDGADLCPLGAGAMTGQELDWDRARMAALLGFSAPHPHSLTAVASRTWVLEVAAEGSTLGVVLSRFLTDLMAWGSGAYQFIDLPDTMAGISSAMPQKKNFPVLERIRGRTAHLTAWYVDVAMAQRASAFSNSVEVSKEGSARLCDFFETVRSVLRLLATVLDNLTFLETRMLSVCKREYLGGFSLANALALQTGMAWRTAQVVAGEYIVAAAGKGLSAERTDPGMLALIAHRHGYRLDRAAEMLESSFDPVQGLLRMQTAGSTHPDAVAGLLDQQASAAKVLAATWRAHGERAAVAAADLDRVLGLRGLAQTRGEPDDAGY